MTWVLVLTVAGGWRQDARTQTPAATPGSAVHSAIAWPPVFRFVQVVPEVYVAYQPSVTGMFHGNQTFVIDDDDVFVFDANFTPGAAKATIAMLRNVTNKPVRDLAYSHWHNDHVWGTQAILDAFPGPINLIATDSTRDDILHQDQEKHGELAKFYVDLLASVDTGLASGLDPDSKKPLTVHQRADLDSLRDELGTYMIPQSGTIAYHLPTITFRRHLTLYRGSREIQLLNFGRGNTRGDAVVWLPKERVVMTGDLLVYPIPFAFNTYITEWIAALNAIKALGARYIIPGHGPVQSNNQYLDLMIGLLTSIRDQTKRAAAAKLTLAQTQKAIHLESFRARFTHGDADLEDLWEGYIPPALQSGYEEATREKRERGN